MQFALASCVALLAAVASAVTPANTAQPPSGNPIAKPGLGEIVPAGTTYTITWAPDSAGPVSILLLRGPSDNVVPMSTIADSIPNSGTFAWSVPTTLQPDTTHYGLQLIVEGTGQYQYSTQFGISNDAYTSSALPSTGSNTVTLAPNTQSATSFAALPTMYGTGSANVSSPVLAPTSSMTVPETLRSTFTRTSRSTQATAEAAQPTASGAAAAVHVQGGLVGLAVAAVGMLMV